MGNKIMQHSFGQHSLQLSQWLGSHSGCSEMRDDYRPFEPATALRGGNPGI